MPEAAAGHRQLALQVPLQEYAGRAYGLQPFQCPFDCAEPGIKGVHPLLLHRRLQRHPTLVLLIPRNGRRHCPSVGVLARRP